MKVKEENEKVGLKLNMTQRDGMGNTCKSMANFMSMYGKNHHNIVK